LRHPDVPDDGQRAPVVAANLKRIGINVEIENVEYAVWIKRWPRDFDMTMNTTPGRRPDTAFFRALQRPKARIGTARVRPTSTGC
jgi:ABC-type transport system substrate-binding protein